MRSYFKIINIVSFILISGFSQAQYSFPSAEKIELGQKLRKKFPENKVYCVKSEYNYNFIIKNSKVVAQLEIEKNFIGLRDNLKFSEIEFYDDYSSVDKIYGYVQKGRRKAPVNIRVTDAKYSSNGIFHDDVRYKQIPFTFSRLGDDFTVQIRKTFLDLKYLTRTFFFESFPQEEKVITFSIPNWLDVELLEYNFDDYQIKKEVIKGKSATSYQYSLKDIEGIVKEPGAPRTDNYLPHIVILCKSYSLSSSKETLFGSPDDFYRWCSGLVSEVVNDPKDIGPFVNDLISDASNDVEKVKKIFYWVQDNIRYIAFENGIAAFKPASAQHVFQNKYADCKGMANLLKEMLIIAGFDARFAWIGTKGVPYDFSVPSLSNANHAICALFLKDSIYYLDATEEFSPFGEVANRIQGRQVMIEDGKSYIIKKVEEFPSDKNKVQKHTQFSLKDNKLVGSYSLVYNGESRRDLLRSYNNLKSESREDALNRYLSKADKDFIISEINSSDLSDREGQLKIDYKFQISNKVIQLDKEVYVNINFDNEIGSLIPLEERKSNFSFYQKVNREVKTTFIIPKGYSISYLPENIHLENEKYSLQLTYKKEKNRVVCYKLINFKNDLLPKQDFNMALNDFKNFKKLNEEPIILIKN